MNRRRETINHSDEKKFTYEEKYQITYDNLADVYFETSIHGQIIDLSPSIRYVFKGLPDRDNLVGQSVLDIYSDPNDRNAFSSQLLRTETVSDYEILFKNGNYPLLPCSVSANLCFDPQGYPERITGIIRDNSAWQQFENEILGGKNNLRSLMDNSAETIFILNKDGRCIYLNRMAKEMLGYSLEEIQGMLFKDIVHASRKDKWSQYLSTILSKDIEHIEIDIHKKDGIIVPAEVKIVLIKNDTGKEHIWLSARDISKRKKSENDLVEKDKLLISIVENIPDMIFVKDAKNLNYVHFNKAGEDLLGFSKEELIGRNDYDYFSKEMADIFTKKDRETIRSDRHLHIPEENINTKLGRRILSTKKFTLKDRSGNPAFLIGISRDITERKQAETKLIESEAYYRTLVNISPDGILVTDLNGVIRFGSEKLAQIFEVSGNETLGGKSAFDWIAPESMEKAKMDFNALIGGIIEYENKRFVLNNHEKSKWSQSSEIVVDNNIVGKIIVCYTEMPKSGECFLPEEYKLLNTVAGRLSQYIFYNKLTSTIELLSNEVLNYKEDQYLKPFSDEHWKWRYRMVQNIAEQTDFDYYGLKAMYIIGSTKEATAGPGSDIDLMVHFIGTEEQKKLFLAWIDGWNHSLSEYNREKTGYSLKDGIIDLHIITDEDIAQKNSFAIMIGNANNPARLIKKVG